MHKEIEKTKELADEICLEIAKNAISLPNLCKQNPHWPKKTFIYEWLAKDKAFADQYARAKMLQVTPLLEEAIDIASDSSNDYIETENGRKVDHDHIARARLKIDTIKWFASKLVPKVYGDKITTEVVQDTKEIDRDRELIQKCKTIE